MDNTTSSTQMLKKLFAEATNESAKKMEIWTGGEINLVLDDVVHVPLEFVSDQIEGINDLLTMVVHEIQGDAGGTLIVMFDEQTAGDFVSHMLARPRNYSAEWTDLEESVLRETGNILSSAYTAALTEQLMQIILPSPPILIRDFGCSILGQALFEQASESDAVWICRTRFQRGGEDLNWQVFFIPNPNMCRILENLVAA